MWMSIYWFMPEIGFLSKSGDANWLVCSLKVGVPAMAPTPTRALTWNRSSTSEWVALIATHTMPCESKANAACRHQLLPPRSRHTLPNLGGKWNWLQSVTWSILPCSCECVVLCRIYMITTIVQSICMTFCLRHGLLTDSQISHFSEQILNY